MKYVLTLLALLVFSERTYAFLDPPERFRQKTKNVEIARVYQSQEKTTALCLFFGVGDAMACAVQVGIKRETKCLLIMPDGLSNRGVRHEEAHCYGWRHG